MRLCQACSSHLCVSLPFVAHSFSFTRLSTHCDTPFTSQIRRHVSSILPRPRLDHIFSCQSLPVQQDSSSKTHTRPRARVGRSTHDAVPNEVYESDGYIPWHRWTIHMDGCCVACMDSQRPAYKRRSTEAVGSDMQPLNRHSCVVDTLSMPPCRSLTRFTGYGAAGLYYRPSLDRLQVILNALVDALPPRAPRRVYPPLDSDDSDEDEDKVEGRVDARQKAVMAEALEAIHRCALEMQGRQGFATVATVHEQVWALWIEIVLDEVRWERFLKYARTLLLLRSDGGSTFSFFSSLTG